MASRCRWPIPAPASPSDRARVVERFVRLEASRNSPGTGLGLSLVAAVARLHDARFDLDDNHPGLKATLIFARGPEAHRRAPAGAQLGASTCPGRDGKKGACPTPSPPMPSCPRPSIRRAPPARSRIWPRRGRLRAAAAAHAVLAAVFGNSPFLARLALRERDLFAGLVERGPRLVLAEIEAMALRRPPPPRIRSRRWPRCAAPSATPRLPSRWPISRGLWDLATVTGALTRFADACVGGALRFLLREAAAASRTGRDRSGDARSHHRPHRPGHGQIRRLRAELFQRYRPRSSSTTPSAFPSARRTTCARPRSISSRAWSSF